MEGSHLYMTKKQFQAESKRLLEMMINSIYTQREIFLRELISNASDAIDKIYYRALTDSQLVFNKEDYYIQVTVDKDCRTLTISDTGIGMSQADLESNLGVIAKSGSLAFKKENELKDGHNIIGQFGVGFYSAFMVADEVMVISKALGSEEAFKWESKGADGYTITPCEKATVGTDVILRIKPNTDDDQYDEFLEPYRLKEIIKKYSDFIRYPIKSEDQTVNSMVPIWRKNKNELTAEDYEQFYNEKHYGFDKPLKHVHVSADGAVSYNAILFIPEHTPFDYYSREYEKGLELYSNGVLIMEKCADLLPDYYSFVKGMVDSEDLSLNISREMLQHDRQLKLIAKNIKSKIKGQLKSLLKDERDKYEQFYKAFGRQLKYGVYSDYGMNKEELQDLLLFASSKGKKLVTLEEYVSRMPEEQKYIYYATGDSIERIEKLPQAERVTDKGYELLYFTDEIDEFAIKMLMKFQEKEFKSISSGDLGIDSDADEKEKEGDAEENQALFEYMAAQLSGKVTNVKASKRLKSHPVCLSSEGEVTIEMEKILKAMPNSQDVTAEKVLELNTEHPVFQSLKEAFAGDKAKLDLYTSLLYNQARLIEGLPVEDPVEFAKGICKVMV